MVLFIHILISLKIYCDRVKLSIYQFQKQETFEEIIEKFQETVMSVKILSGDDDFESLTKCEEEEVLQIKSSSSYDS